MSNKLYHNEFRHTAKYKYNIDLKQFLTDNNLPNELTSLGTIIYDYAKSFILSPGDAYYTLPVKEHQFIADLRESLKRQNPFLNTETIQFKY